MSYENYMLLYYISLAACIVLFLVTVLLFFVLRIPKAFGDITGRTARKAIKSINEQNEKAKIQRETERMGAKETDRISGSGRIIEENPGNTVVTEKIQTENLGYSAETTVLSENAAGETTLLESRAGETTVLEGSAGETTVLDADSMPGILTEETAPLNEAGIVSEEGFCREIQSILFIHTTEIIM